MNQLQHYLLMLIDEQLIDVEEYISYDKIIAELVPVYKQEKMSLDETQIITALAEMVDNGYLESTYKNFRITVRGLIYTRSYPIIAEVIESQVKGVKSSVSYLWLGVIVVGILSLIALFLK